MDFIRYRKFGGKANLSSECDKVKTLPMVCDPHQAAEQTNAIFPSTSRI